MGLMGGGGGGGGQINLIFAPQKPSTGSDPLEKRFLLLFQWYVDYKWHHERWELGVPKGLTSSAGPRDRCSVLHQTPG